MTADETKDQPPQIDLARADLDAYCRFAAGARHGETWWYLTGLAPYRHYSRPFQDGRGTWWFTVKPGFAWPLDFFRPVERPARLPRRCLLGAQWPVRQGANSAVCMNVIQDLSAYSMRQVASNKRRAVRKGLRTLTIAAADPADAQTARRCCEVWNSHVQRTEWNTAMAPERFVQSWQELAAWPGTTVLLARDPQADDAVCAWTVLRGIDDVIYVDTLASHTDRLRNRPNDALIYTTLVRAQQLGFGRAHYSLKSSLESLERFKESMGFVPHSFSARLKLRWPVGPLMRVLRPGTYARLLGRGAPPAGDHEG